MTADETFTAALLGFGLVIVVTMLLVAGAIRPLDPLTQLLAGYQ